MKNENFRHLLEIQLAMFCISTSGALGRSIEIAPPLAIWWRALPALIFLGLYCWWRGFSFRLGSGQNRRIVLFSGLLMGIHWITYFYALQLSNVAVGMLSLFTYPVMTALLEPLILKTPFQKIQLLLGGIVLLGISFLIPSFELDNSVTQGALIGLVSAFVYALRNVFLKTQINNFNGSVMIFYQMIVILVMLFPVLFFYSSAEVPKYTTQFILLGLVTTTIGHTLFLNSFKHFSVSTASIMSGMQPIYGILLAMIFLKEYPNWQSLIGGALILMTVVIESRRTRKIG